MQVKQASNSDKTSVLEFCQNTFSWGDYISQVWDYWILEGNLLVIHEKNEPVAICHATFYDRNMWIEGIRIHPSYRRRGFAKNLLKRCEEISQQNNCLTAQMLIETNNSNSINLAKTQNYTIKETWNFYSLEKIISTKNKVIDFALTQTRKDILLSSNFNYVDSWRWYSLNNEKINFLSKENRIIFSQNENVLSIAIYADSKHFANTVIVTILTGNDTGIRNILHEIQSISSKKNYTRIQILTKLTSLPKFSGLEKKLSFHLVEKQL